jgi:hypothetical protein
VNPGQAYWAGVILIGAATAAVARLAGPESRPGILLALGSTLALQAPMGWWLLRSVRLGQAMGVWALGIALRLALVGVVGLVVLPVLGWPQGPALVTLAALLLVLLLLEGAVLWLEHFGSEDR